MDKCIVVDINTSHIGVDPQEDINDVIRDQFVQGLKLKSFQIDSGTSLAYLIFGA